MAHTGKYICGCGLSSTFPICDGAHAVAKSRSGVPTRCGPAFTAQAPAAGLPKLSEREPVCASSPREVDALIA
jgi:hypothetical protein